MNAIAHQEELDKMQQLDGIVRHKDELGDEFETHVWADDDTVYINIRSGVAITSFHFTKNAADVLADQIAIALRRWA